MRANSAPPPIGPTAQDPHGQAALILVESLIHTLVGNQVLSVRDAVTTIEVARDAQIAMADVERSPAATTHLLEAMLQSMEHDLPGDGLHG
jgi:hypothetical protein